MRNPLRKLVSLVSAMLIPTMLLNSAFPCAAAVGRTGAAGGVASAVVQHVATAPVGPPATPLAAHVPTHDDRFAAGKSAEALLASVPLGAKVTTILKSAGTPYMAVRQSGRMYWTYSVDSDHAWLVIGSDSDTITSVQIIPKARQKSTLRDLNGVAAGDPASHLKLGPLFKNPNLELDRLAFMPHGIGKRFYGVASDGNVTRMGLSTGDTTMPVFIRWFDVTGWTVDRAIPFSAYGGNVAGEDAYLASMQERHLQCLGGNSWHAIGRKIVMFAGVPIDRVTAQCGVQSVVRPIFFNRSLTTPRGYDADVYAQHVLAGVPISSPQGVARRTTRTIAYHPGVLLDAQTPPMPPVGRVWITRPNGARCILTNEYSCDIDIAYTEDPSNPLQSVSLDVTAVDPAHPLALGKARLVASTRWIAGKRLAQSGSSTSPISCSFSAGGGKCTFRFEGDSAPCASGSATFQFGSVAVNRVCYGVARMPGSLPRPPGGNGGPNDSNCGSGGASGKPIDAVSGELRYEHQDAALAGPFGLSFSRRYDSQRPIEYPSSYYERPSPFPTLIVPPSTPPTSGLGTWWKTNYSYFVSAWTYQPVGGGYPTYFNVHFPDCRTASFALPSGAASTFDQYSGDTLSVGGGGLTLTTWDNQKIAFVAAGTMMWAVASVTDRVGNTQTLDYTGGSGKPTKISDGLGRSLNLSYTPSGNLSSVTSTPSGINEAFTYSGVNCSGSELCTATESDGAQWAFQYGTGGQSELLTQVTDPTSHIEESNQYQNFDFGSGDVHYRVTHQEVDGGKQARDYAYSYGQTTISDALGISHQTIYRWDQLLQQVTSVQGPLCNCNGNTLSFAYDTFGRLLRMAEGPSDGAQAVTTYTYGRDTSYVSPDGLTKYSVLAIPGPTAVDEPQQTTQNGLASRHMAYAYYPAGDPRQDLVTTITDSSVDMPGASATTSLTYSLAGRATNVSRTGFINGTSATRSLAMTYDTLGRVLTISGPRTDLTQLTQFGYFADNDADLAKRGQLSTVTNAASQTSAFASAASPNNTYSIFGQPLSMSDANGVTRTLGYDGMGRLTSMTLLGVPGDTANLTTSMTHDGIGQLLRTTRPLGNSLLAIFDGANETVATVLSDAGGLQHDRMLMGYDAMSRPIAQAAQNCLSPAAACSSWITQYSAGQQFTGNDQLASSQAGVPGATSFAYGNTGSLTSTTTGDANYSVLQTIARDPAHYATGVLLGKGDASLAFTHDLQGNPDRVTPQQSSSTVYHYDDFGQVTTETSPLTGRTTYIPDAAGNVTSRTDANGATTTTTYDALNRPLVQTSTRSGRATETVTRTYDSTASGAFGLGRLATMTDPSGSNTYTYERRGLVATRTQVINGTTYPTTYAYDGNGNRTSMLLPSGRQLTYAFDYADRPISVGSPSTTYVAAASYEPFGPMTKLQFGNGTTQTWSYTQRYLPAEEKLTTASATLSDLQYTENGAGFVTAITDALDAGYNRTFAYGGRATNMLTQANTGSKLWHSASYFDGLNQNLTTIAYPGARRGLKYSQPAQQLTAISDGDTGTTQAVTHDAAGNETAIGTSAYTYSARNHLSAGDGITYAYDGSGQRVVATASAGTRASLYGPGMHLQSESGLTSGSIAYDYVWFGNRPIAQEDVGGGTHWTVADHLGTPFLQTDAAASVYWQADYQPFGAVAGLRTADAHQPLRFPGQEAEEFTLSAGPNGASARFFNGARWYRPTLGRYTQADPIEYAGGQASLYAYAMNNPIDFVDPLGLACGMGLSGAQAFALGFGIGLATAFAPEIGAFGAAAYA